jgi:hypothetical protein
LIVCSRARSCEREKEVLKKSIEREEEKRRRLL